MNLFGIHFGQPSTAALDALIARNRDRSVTYDHVGSTSSLPHGRRFHQEWRDVGQGKADFERAVAGLRAWAGHTHIGAYVHPPGAPLAEGTDMVVVLPLGPLAALAPDRVVAVVEEPDRVAFSYGTLPGHPENGEETFALDLLADGTVRFTISVDARPGNALMWLGCPVVHLMQRRALRGYLAGIAAYVQAD